MNDLQLVRRLILNFTMNYLWDYAWLLKENSIVFHHDNARLHTSLVIRQRLQELGAKYWEVRICFKKGGALCRRGGAWKETDHYVFPIN